MNRLFDINVSKNRLSATLTINPDVTDDTAWDQDALLGLLKERKIVFGYKHGVIQQICDNPYSVEYPVTVAEGIPPQNGEDAYLQNEIHEEQKSTSGDKFDFRNILTIPSVKDGQLLASIISPTQGTAGKDIYGNILPARDGRQLRLKPGKNILFQNDQFFATTDGQISITSNSINVFPIFEVKGDIDMKTGNVDFIGNVTIHGNVPPGYRIKAGGDIRINGIVEASVIEAGGSIHIRGGIAGQLKGSVKAGVDLHTRYLNQANVEAGNDIVTETFIMNSAVTAGRKIKGENIIGGKLSAGEVIEVSEIGNQHFARADLFIGSFAENVEKERQVQAEIFKLKDSLKKLEALKEKLKMVLAAKGNAEGKEQEMLQRQQATYFALKSQLDNLELELAELHEKDNPGAHSYLRVKGQLYPNNQIHFSKYSKLIHNPISSVKIFLNQGEITSIPL
ncbi:DUF342 domain-containing protein [Bacillus sp. V59.32b]|uniref:DUF342 domain-containing protein n=1 Tax=Bacillus sp. V59.32b TaxID=1758642 RepID=UPI00135A8617|nr:FapA family protein [Bacillus sp. V59.32b]